jgi:hypothetical protein
MTDTKSKLHVAPDPEPAAEGEELSIAKPSTFDLNKFVSKRSAAVASVETLQTALPHHSMSQAKDFVRLHPDEDTHWTPELCFLNVPIKGVKRDTLHLIEEKVAREDHALPSRAGEQALRRLLSLSRAEPEPRQPLEREQPEGM